MPNGKVRVTGSSYTTFQYKGKDIAFCEVVEDSGQDAYSDIGQPYQFIQPLGHRHPIEIATSRTLQGGTLQLTIRETWNTPVWEQLAGLNGAANITDIYDRLARDPQYVTCQTIIKPPGTGSSGWRGKIFQNCTVVKINDGDTITVAGLSITKGITVAYTHSVAYRAGGAR